MIVCVKLEGASYASEVVDMSFGVSVFTMLSVAYIASKSRSLLNDRRRLPFLHQKRRLSQLR